jgi:hypothetical protein
MATKPKVPTVTVEVRGLDPLRPSASVLCKVASAFVHVEEAAGGGGHVFDLIAVKQLAADPEVKAWMEGMRSLGLLPVKRS